MAAAQPNVTLTFTLSPTVSTQLSVGLQTRRGFLLSNGDQQNSIAVGFGTNNGATVAMHIIPPGGVMAIGEAGNVSGAGPQAGANCPNTDIAAIALAGAPSVAFTEW